MHCYRNLENTNKTFFVGLTFVMNTFSLVRFVRNKKRLTIDVRAPTCENSKQVSKKVFIFLFVL